MPICISKRDLFTREYCPVLKVAKPLAKKTGVKLMILVLKKDHNNNTQHFKTREEREINVKKLFSLNKKAAKMLAKHPGENSVQGKKVLIIDDIYTTGSTVKAVRELLVPLNPQCIDVLSFCRSIGNNVLL